MTKSEYMKLLQENLGQFDRELQEEILEDYRQHFAEGEKQGRTEEEIIRELGNVQEMIQELSEIAAEGSMTSHRTESVECEKTSTYTGPYRAIEIEGAVADIELYASEDEKVHVDYSIDGSESVKRIYSFYQDEKDGVLYVGVKSDQDKKRFWERIVPMNTHNVDIRMEIKIPRGIEQLNLRTTSGQVCIRGLEVGAIKGNTVSGEVGVEDVKAGQLELHTTSGDMKVKGVKTEKMKIGTTSSEIVLKGIWMESGKFSTISGDIAGKEIHADSLVCKTVSGKIGIQTNAKSCQCNTTSGNIALNGKEQNSKLDLNTTSGKISVNLEGSDGLEATVKTVSGKTVVSWKGNRQEGARRRRSTFIFGDGSCKVNANSISGDMEISA